MKRIIAILMIAVLAFALAACGADPVKEVQDKIAAIGDVTLNSAEAIKTAQDAYDALSDDDKAKVENVDVLNTAQEKYAKLVKLDQYKDVFAALKDQTYCFAATSINVMRGLRFIDEENVEYLETAWISGSQSDDPAVAGTFDLDDSVLKITCGSAFTAEIPYTLSGGKITLGDGKTYFDFDDVKEAIQGYWRAAYYNSTKAVKAYNLMIDGDKIAYEAAWPGTHKDGSYYYQDPAEGTITEIVFGGFVSDVYDSSSFGYMVKDGAVVPTIYGADCTKSSDNSFPGKDGYVGVFKFVGGYQLAVGY